MAKKGSKSKAVGADAAIKPDEEWRVESDMNTLIEAEKIKKDPARMAKVKVLARKRLEATATVLAEANESK